ncbi:MAG: sigma-70 family RNA polymerase sigma factor [Candidatus Riflebacteria bacterium]|nr:sigma-70 family RNA polymerase sigma factor [Candidatus Riflebacteria bacterium]
MSLEINKVNPGILLDEQLIKDFQKGSEEAFEVLFDRYFQKIFCYTFSFLKDHEEAKDLTQEIFYKLYKGLKTYQEQGKFKSWMYSVARLTIINRFRKKGKEIVSCDQELVETTGMSDSDNSSGGNDYLSSLSIVEREIISLRILEKLPYEKISEITSLSTSYLRKVVFRILNRFRSEVSKNEM